MKAKICGITRIDDGLLAADLGAWALGFIFYRRSPRYIEAKAVKKIIDQLRGRRKLEFVGVFVNEEQETVEETAKEAGLTMVQLHGEESAEYCKEMSLPVIKAFRPKEKRDLGPMKAYGDVEKFLIDSFHDEKRGGTGEQADWSLALEAKKINEVILAGGLSASNIVEACQKVNPFAVDISSSLEDSPGIKSSEKLEKFFLNLKKV